MKRNAAGGCGVMPEYGPTAHPRGHGNAHSRFIK
jgi:hypothetical protein